MSSDPSNPSHPDSQDENRFAQVAGDFKACRPRVRVRVKLRVPTAKLAARLKSQTTSRSLLYSTSRASGRAFMMMHQAKVRAEGNPGR